MISYSTGIIFWGKLMTLSNSCYISPRIDAQFCFLQSYSDHSKYLSFSLTNIQNCFPKQLPEESDTIFFK
jgi:hypothetical protein